MPEKEGLLQRIRPHAEWEAVKWFVLGGVPTMLAALYALYQTARQLSIDWYVFGGMFLVSLFLLSFALWLSGRNNKSASVSKEPETSLPADIPASSLFTPLQIDAFQLAKGLREFFSETEPKPTYNTTIHHTDGTASAIADAFVRNNDWMDKITNKYSRLFAGEVTDMKYRLGEMGLKSRVFDDIENKVIELDAAIPQLAREIERLAVDINYPELHKLERDAAAARGWF